MKENVIFQQMEEVFDKARIINFEQNDKYIIFSDLHLGNAGPADEFINNSDLFLRLLKDYYYPKNYKLILNGDVEELYKFPYSEIRNRWKEIYDIFLLFKKEDRLYKILGNHDYGLKHEANDEINSVFLDAIKLRWKDNWIFIHHGHVCSNYIEKHNFLSQSLVRYLVRPLRLTNKSFTLNTQKIFDTELRAYKYSSSKKVISIIGHTHKPLFESLSKKDTLAFQMEKLLRKYPKTVKEKKKRKIEALLQQYKDEMKSISQEKQSSLRQLIYKDELLVPCLFNTGSVIGKHGLTGIEIEDGNINLVYCFDKDRSQRYIEYKGVSSENILNQNVYKATLKTESLDYVFSRIKLLS